MGAKVAVADLNLHSYEEFEAEAKDMTADSTFAEIEASAALPWASRVNVRDHEAVETMAGRRVETGTGGPVGQRPSIPDQLQTVIEKSCPGRIESDCPV